MAIVDGIRTVAHLYAGIDDPRLSGSVVADLLDELINLDLAQAREKGRRIRPNNGEPWPERFWVEVEPWLEESQNRGRSYADSLEGGGEPTLAIELSGDDVQNLVSTAHAP